MLWNRTVLEEFEHLKCIILGNIVNFAEKLAVFKVSSLGESLGPFKNGRVGCLSAYRIGIFCVGSFISMPMAMAILLVLTSPLNLG